jgi:hypothetical protein
MVSKSRGDGRWQYRFQPVEGIRLAIQKGGKKLKHIQHRPMGEYLPLGVHKEKGRQEVLKCSLAIDLGNTLKKEGVPCFCG